MTDTGSTDPAHTHPAHTGSAHTDLGSFAMEPLRIERLFRAPIEAVFDAWTSVDVLRRWWPAGRDWEVVDAVAEARVGGRIRLRVQSPNGDSHGGEGRYKHVHRPDKLVFTWQWDDSAGRPGQLVDITFTANDDETTTVVLINTGITDADRADHGRGWSLSLDHLESLLRQGSVPAERWRD